MNKTLLRFKFIFFDIVAALIVWVVFMFFRRVVNDGAVFQGFTIFIPVYNFYTNLFLFPVFCVIIHYLSGYYENPVKESKSLEFFTTLISSAIISFSIFFILLLDDMVISYLNYYYSLMVLFLLLFSVTYLFRIMQSVYIRKNYKLKKWTKNTLIIGTGSNACKIAEGIKRNSKINTVIGFVKADSIEKAVEPDKITGNLNNLKEQIETLDVKEVIIALDDANEQKIFNIINKLFQFDIDIQFTPRLHEILTGKAKINRYGINPLVSISKSSMDDWEISVKRAFDSIVSLLAIILLSPVMIYFSFAIKSDSNGPVLYRQKRIGRNGKEFNMLKFRTMYRLSENGKPKLSSPDDERITKVGRTLRRYRLDEIPQFWNILKGDMSIVGPRPERRFFIDQIIKEAPYYCLLYRIRPGLTSWGPIKIGYSDTIEKMIERLNYDIIYLETMSLLTDMKILVSTFEVLFKGKGI
ncbi:MAG: exopolysaccharide biosynthesis polyprenyl glycosylphosphotransferase [Bacteroidetes bacterium]|nr:exopolysaccharide biosynthesis polyprenyl glycosylphosphotransferase [Bacteroidota bacterium]